jgi:hypothetical protein
MMATSPKKGYVELATAHGNRGIDPCGRNVEGELSFSTRLQNYLRLFPANNVMYFAMGISVELSRPSNAGARWTRPKPTIRRPVGGRSGGDR